MSSDRPGLPISSPGSRSLLDVPCYASSLGLGGTSGLVVAVHRYWGSRSGVSALDWGIKMTCATALVSFALCRTKYHEEKAAVRDAMRRLQEQQQQQRKQQQQQQRDDAN